MKYYLIVIQIIFLFEGVSGQSISGETYVCPGDTWLYQIIDGRCETISSAEWDIVEGTEIDFGLADATEINWHIDTEESTGTVSVSYVCWQPGDSDPIIVEDLTLNVEIRQIQVPLFDEASKVRPIGDNSSFPIATPDQGENFIYSWSFPDCLPGSDGSYFTTITPDMYGIGTVCLTVYDNQCDSEVTECIEVTRSCEDIITYSASDDIPFFTSVDLEINTIGNVVPTLPYVEFKAGETINLTPGFTANPDFLAHIGECGRSPDSEGCIGMGTSGLVTGNEIFGDMEIISSKSLKLAKSEINLSELKNDIKVMISPNPVSDYLTIAIDDFDLKQEHAFEILSFNGQLLLNGLISDQRISLDISSLNSGIYLVKVFTENDISVARFVKY